MKSSKVAKAKKRLMTQAEMKKVVSACRVLLDAGLISPKKSDYIARNYR